ncbi:cyclin-T1-like [Apus apus]|uniref:cyclin-T1-like n=1 Tax=Apus apus TaxID=8895 RepID=UPI0021F86186|nr:cyclin-T1-like [Apus apus]
MEDPASGGAGGTAGPRWYFSRQQLDCSPSRRAGIDSPRELWYRQQAARLVQDMGQRLHLSQLAINTAIIYMHRFYMVQSFTQFHRNSVAPAALFLAAKVEEQKRAAQEVINAAHSCLHPLEPPLEPESEAFLQQGQDLVSLESIILETLGFEILVDHPHTHVVKCAQLVQASKDLARTAYHLATKSLQLTTFSLRYTPPVVACICIHLACKQSNWEVPVSKDGKHWWEHMDGGITLELLDELSLEFQQILEKNPSQRKHLWSWRASQEAKKLKAVDTSGHQQRVETSETGWWYRPARLDLDETPRKSKRAWIDECLRQQGIICCQEQSGQNSEVSLQEPEAKRAKEVEAQQQQLENTGAKVGCQYTCTSQDPLVQQQQKREGQQDDNPSHQHLHPQLGGSPSSVANKCPEGSQPSPVPSPVSHKGHGPLGSSRKRPLPEELEATAATLEHQPKASKVSKGPEEPLPNPCLPGAAPVPGHSLQAGSLPLSQDPHDTSEEGPTEAQWPHNTSEKAQGPHTSQASEDPNVPLLHSHPLDLLASNSTSTATHIDKPGPSPCPQNCPPGSPLCPGKAPLEDGVFTEPKPGLSL